MNQQACYATLEKLARYKGFLDPYDFLDTIYDSQNQPGICLACDTVVDGVDDKVICCPMCEEPQVYSALFLDELEGQFALYEKK
jgi:hypothetical protein